MSLNPAAEHMRQSFWALLFIGTHTLRRIVYRWWPLLIIFLKPSENGTYYKLYFILGAFGLVSIITSIITFARFHFWLDEGNIYLEQGVFKKSKVTVPFERIQSVNTEQSVLYRFLGLVKIDIDTAGSKGNEVSIKALKASVAEEIVAYISANKKEIVVDQSESVIESETVEASQIGENFLTLNPLDLLKVGLAQNHLRAILILGAFLFSRFEDARGLLGEDFYNRLDRYADSTWFTDVAVISTVVFAALLLSVLVSILTVLTRHFNFSLFETAKGIRVESGLFTKKVRSVNYKRTQLFQINQGPIRKLFGMPNIKIYQAAAEGPTGKSAVLIPGCPTDQVETLKTRFFKGIDMDFGLDHGIDSSYAFRRWLFSGLPLGIVTAVILLLNDWWFYMPLVALYMAYNLLTHWLNYRVYRFGFTEDLLTVSSGFWIRKTKSILIYKVQAVTLRQGIYQRKHQLVDVNLYTAGGTLVIPYVALDFGKSLTDFILYRIESTRESWM